MKKEMICANCGSKAVTRYNVFLKARNILIFLAFTSLLIPVVGIVGFLIFLIGSLVCWYMSRLWKKDIFICRTCKYNWKE